MDYDDDFGLDLVDDDLGYDDEDDDFGYDDFGDDDDDDDDLGAMDYASLGGMDYASLGRRRKRRPAKRGRGRRRPARRRAPSKRRAAPAKAKAVVQKTILTGFVALDNAAGAITIRPQFDFVAEDLTLVAVTAAAWTLTAVQFGDRIVFSNPTGVPIAVFAVGGFMRGLVKGAAIAAGLDIQLSVVTTTTETITAVFTGLKRGTTGCGPGAV